MDVLVSGLDHDIRAPFPIKYSYQGYGFFFGKKGGIDWLKTLRKNKIIHFLREIRYAPIDHYDLIINDFEPVTAWAAKRKGIPIIGIGNQHSLLSPHSPKAKIWAPLSKAVIRHYAPTPHWLGFHFQAYEERIFTPTVRQEVSRIQVRNMEHISVYLPAYSAEAMAQILHQFPEQKWEVFIKGTRKETQNKNILFKPISAQAFLQSMANSSGVLTGGGFATPAEALYLGKKLMLIPMKGQYEQQCNAQALEEMGVPQIKALDKNSIPKIREWLVKGKAPKVDYKNNTEEFVLRIMKEFSNSF